MRRLLLLVAAVVCVDTMLYAALTPLLGQFAREFDLSRSTAGALVAAYAVGALIGGLPAGYFAASVGSRSAVVVGLVMMAAASVVFGLAGDSAELFAGRLLQGVASAFTWSGAFGWLLAVAPRDRRGELIGFGMGAAVFGALFGPVIGVLAALAGRATVFCALAVLVAALVPWTLRLGAPPPARPAAASLASAFVDSQFLAGLALLVLAALLAGVIALLGPLHLAARGWSAAAIGAVWLLGAALEAGAAPFVGRLSDRRGVLWPVRAALGAAAILSLALAFDRVVAVYPLLLVFASVTYGTLFVPSFALIAAGADEAGLPQGLAFGLMNAFWALGAAIGPAAAGAIAVATGDRLPLALAALLCAMTLILVSAATHRRRRRHAATRCPVSDGSASGAR